MRKIFWTLLACLLLFVGTLFLLWFNLDWIFTEKNIRRVAEYTDTDMRWDILNLKIENIGLLTKDIHFQSKNLCLKHFEPSIEFCVENSDINIEATIITHSPYIQFRNIDLSLIFSHFVLTISPSDKDGTKPFEWPEVEFGSFDSLLAAYFEKLPIEVIKILDVRIKNIKVFLPTMDLASKSLTIKKNSEISIETSFQILRQKKTFLLGSLLANLNLQSPLKLLATGRLNFPSLKFSTSLSLNWQNILSIKVNSRLKQKDLKILSRTSLNLTKNHWSAWPQAEIFYPKLPFKKVLIRDCPLLLSFKHRKPELLKNECTVILNKFTKRLLPKFPESLYFKTKLEVPLLLQSSILTARPAISVTLQKSSLLTFDLYASIQSVIDMTNKKIIKTNIDSFRSELNMPKFEETVLFLKNSRWSVPAPLNILQGPIQLRLSGIPTEIQTQDFAAKALLKTDLKSPSQRLKTEGNFNIILTAEKFRVGISGIISLKDVKIQLPSISLRDPPSLMPDPRFKKTKKKTGNLFSNSKIFEITDLIVRTEEKPILLQANLVPNLLPDPVPVRLHYRIKPSFLKMTGKVSIDKMNLEIFKRKAIVEKFNLIKYANSKVQDIDAVITYRTSEVLVKILIAGPTDKPRLELISDPPLTRQQIISILIFNKSLHELTDEELSSTSHLDQALLSSAFGLASLFLLSSTPIDSIYFDPRTSSYTARIRIDRKTSISIVSDFESSRQFIWRRRLRGPWSISTQVESSDSEDSITTMIEWFKRF